MAALPRYAVAWDAIFGLTPHLRDGAPTSVDAFSRAIVNKMEPAPAVDGLEHLPTSPRFLLVANHYQRPGCWILHPSSVLTQAIRNHYGPGDPPVRWIVTANWPPLRLGRWKIASPGDVLLPRVAKALDCYPVSFAGQNPAFTAASLKRILRDARTATRPIGLYPEGVAGVAGQLTDPLPGVDRLIHHLAKAGLPLVPVGIWETDRMHCRFGRLLPAADLLAAPDAARLAMEHIAGVLGAV